MTSILTEDEINGIADKHEAALGGVWPHEFAEAIIDATIKRLAAGVSVEPYATLHHDDGYFTTKQREHDLRYSGPMRTEVVTLDQLTTAIAAARVAENERCAKVCESTSWSEDIDVWREMTKRDVSVKSMLACAEAIRASIGETK